MITLNDFLTSKKKIAPTSSVICLKSASYPLLFGRLFAHAYAKKIDCEFAVMSMQAESLPSTMGSLQSSFLGQKRCYWLGSDESLSKKKLDEWRQFLTEYRGPHVVIFSTEISGSIPHSWNIIELPEMVKKAQFELISRMILEKPVPFQHELFKSTDAVPIETAVLLSHYGAVVGKSSAQFSKEWLPKIIVGDTSLFALSQALFDRESQSFFILWKKIQHHYPIQFWITFWSEQIWRAYWYIQLQQKKKLSDAKKMSYRLPFSFTRMQWRRHSMRELERAHALLYDIDFHLKNGGSSYSLDLFFSSFFNH